jgi:NagD protein
MASQAHKDKKGYLFDLDRILYRGKDNTPEAKELINRLQAGRFPFLFLTNNNLDTRREMVIKMRKLGFSIGETHILTSATVLAHFLRKQKPNGKAFVISDGCIKATLLDHNYQLSDENPDFVIIGESLSFKMDLIENAVKMLLSGAKLVSANPASLRITDKSISPAGGAIAAMLERATGARAFFVGKPSPIMLRMAHKELNMPASAITIVGDSMESDIFGGVQMGFRTALILSEERQRSTLNEYAFRPDIIINSLGDLNCEI